jgi:hypothetical protein
VVFAVNFVKPEKGSIPENKTKQNSLHDDWRQCTKNTRHPQLYTLDKKASDRLLFGNPVLEFLQHLHVRLPYQLHVAGYQVKATNRDDKQVSRACSTPETVH